MGHLARPQTYADRCSERLRSPPLQSEHATRSTLVLLGAPDESRHVSVVVASMLFQPPRNSPHMLDERRRI